MERSSHLSTSYSQEKSVSGHGTRASLPGLLLSNTSGITCTKLLFFFFFFFFAYFILNDYIFTFMLLVFHFFK